ncbi:MAG: UPF0104 family protein [Sphingomonadaceae bacterium]|nr:UPF0104 family protein [Sphingomonadaceae bacterium]
MVGGSNPSGPTGGTAPDARADGCPDDAPRPATPWWRHALVAAASLVIAALAIGAVRRLAHEVTLATLTAALHAVPWPTIALAAVLTTTSYLLLTLYDWLALDHLGYRLRLGTVMTAAFTGFTMSHTLGLTPLTGGSVRYRIYGRAGVCGRDIVLVVALCAWTFWLGIVLAAGTGLLIAPTLAGLPAALGRAGGATLLGGAVAYLVATATFRGELRLFGFRLALPSFPGALAQLGAGIADLLAAATALYILLPAGPAFPLVVTTYAVAMIAGALSHAPGGLGVFEAIVLLMLPGLDRGGVLAGLLLFRLLYTVLPFTAGLIVLATTEAAALRRQRRQTRAARAAAAP